MRTYLGRDRGLANDLHSRSPQSAESSALAPRKSLTSARKFTGMPVSPKANYPNKFGSGLLPFTFSSLPITIGEPSDPLEREADRLADRILRKPSSDAPPDSPTQKPLAGGSSIPRLLGSSGSPLDLQLRSFMEPRFKWDFSQVRVHDGLEAARAAGALRARAFASGPDIVFGRGEYSPSTTEGRRLIAHELAHLVQESCGAQSGLIRRKEVQNAADLKGQQDWLTSDRENNAQRWKDACMFNLMATDSGQYVRIVERRDFYKWFYDYTQAQGYTTRWALAASVVASGAEQIADMDAGIGVGSFGNSLFSMANVELQGAMREGNQVIFDNVLPKLKTLIVNGKLSGPAALKWDMQTLAEEQTLIQPLYSKMAPETLAQMNSIARKGFITKVGGFFTGGDKVGDTPGVEGGRVPAFDQPDLQNINDRWKYGMMLGNKFTPGGSGYDPSRDTMPAASEGYTKGTEFAKVDTRAHLHELDAWLNPDRKDRVGPGSDYNAIIAALSDSEKRLVLSDRSPDGWAYSIQFAQFSFIDEATVRKALPTDPASAAAVDAFIARYKKERERVYMSTPSGMYGGGF
jgi:Domain of unknown function (DUF4157)